MEEALSEQENLGPSAAPDNNQRGTKANVSQFFLSLIQAFLRTGYYTPDHPESEKARVGLYEDFQKVFDQKSELTFLVREDTQGTNIQIEGALPEPHDLNKLMLPGMAELYTPKFSNFLDRKDLVSLTLKSTMTKEEFTNFVDVVGEPNFVDTREKSDKERFIQTLHDKGISNISFIFKEDLLATKRDIPWRSQIAISRLKKDFKMVPLYHNLDDEGMKEVRRQIVRDIFRPIHNGKVIYPILMNSDLAETKEFKESEIDQELIACISDELLLDISKRLLKEALPFGESGPLKKKAIGLAPQIASYLNQRKVTGREPVLETLFKRKLIAADALPQDAQRKIKIEQLTDKFIEQSKSFMDQFDKLEDGEKYVKVAQSFAGMIPELIRRDCYEEILEIITRIHRHFNTNEQLSAYAGQILEEIKTGEIPGALKGRFLTGKKEICHAIAPIFLKLQKASLPHIISILKESNDQLVLKIACEMLIQIDPLAFKSVLDELNKEEISTEFAIDIIRVLGEIKRDEWIKPLSKTLRAYLKHENPHLRGEALWVYYKIVGGTGEKQYLSLLEDPDTSVQKKAIQCLGRIKSQIGLKKFLQMLKKSEDTESDKNKHMDTSIINALGFYGNVECPGVGTLESYLLEILDRQVDLGPLKFLKKKKNPNPLRDGAIAAICETLGKIGTDKSRPILHKLVKQQDSLWQDKAEEALAKIAERKAGGSSSQAQ